MSSQNQTTSSKYTANIAALDVALLQEFGATMDEVRPGLCFDRYFYKPKMAVRWSDFARLAAQYGAIAMQIPGEDRLVMDLSFDVPSGTQPDEFEFYKELESAELNGALPVGLGYDCGKIAVYDMVQLGNVLVSCNKYIYMENMFVGSSVLNKCKLMFIGTADSNYITAYELCQNRVGDITDNIVDAIRTIYDLNGYIKYRAEHNDGTNIVVFIDNLDQIIQADENIIQVLQSILQRAADAGVYIVCVEHDNYNVISPELRAAFTTKIAFKMPTADISQQVLGSSGAELLGNDEMLLYIDCLPPVHLALPSM